MSSTGTKALQSVLQEIGLDPSRTQPLAPDELPGAIRITCPGDRALPIWSALRKKVSRLGYWPVLFGDAEADDAVMSRLEGMPIGGVDRLRADTLSGAEQIDPAEWCRQTRRRLGLTNPEEMRSLAQHLRHSGSENLAGMVEEQASSGAGLSSSGVFALANSRWPEPMPAPRAGFTGPLETPDRCVATACLGLLPTSHGWEVPSLLQWGGVASNPQPSVHVAMLRRWKSDYGADLLTLGSSVMELLVSRPPATRLDAVRVARDHQAYCPDIPHFEPECQQITYHAARLLNSHVWWFRWV